MEAQIAGDVIDFFIEHLDKLEKTETISLYLYTRGGNTASAWNIVNLLRMFCHKLQVIVPHKAHSAGTIISLGANEIVMTKQATLSPIDPSINTQLNPKNPDGLGTYSVSVEAVNGYLEYAKNILEINDPSALASIYLKLSEYVHPLVLGQAYRSRAQIQMLATKLLKNQPIGEDKIKEITDFLCSESGGHDYTINRDEAKQILGLNIITPTEKQYRIIKKIYDDVADELQLGKNFELSEINGEYAVRRGLLESIIGGSDYFITEGRVVHLQIPNTPIGTQDAIQNRISFEGWRHEDILDKSDYETEGKGEVVYERSDEFQM